MKFRKVLIITLSILSIFLTIKIIRNYYHTSVIKENNEKNIIAINKTFNDTVKRQKAKSDDIKDIKPEMPVKVYTTKNKEIITNVIGRIVIKRISLDYPIIEGATEDNLNISITRFYGSTINSIGNCILAGHNMKNGSLFGKLSALEKNDSIILYDSSGSSKEYRVFNIKIIEPTDLSILYQDTNNEKWVTLLTCTDSGKKRLIVEAKEV